MLKYHDRQAAGKTLSESLKHYANNKNVIVLALPRGGVPVGYEIAAALHVPLDIFIVRKLGVPGHEELAFGALATGGVVVFNEDILQQLQISQTTIESVKAKEIEELQRREKKYRSNWSFPVLNNKIIILVDDGIATGATIRAAIKSLRTLNPARLVLAVPVAQADTSKQMSHLVDEFICPLKPTALNAVGAWYDYFDQTSDEEVQMLLAKSFTR